jgi:hypothetical protein
MRQIITANDIKKYRSISDFAPVGKITPFIMDAQIVELKNLLGKDLFLKVVENISPLNYPELDPMIEPILAFYSYQRYVVQSQTNVTAFGVVQKNTDFSTSATDKTISRITAQAREMAKVYEDILIEFLDENIDNYPEWKSRCNRKGKNSGTIGYSVVGDKKDINDFVKDEVNRLGRNIFINRR